MLGTIVRRHHQPVDTVLVDTNLIIALTRVKMVLSPVVLTVGIVSRTPGSTLTQLSIDHVMLTSLNKTVSEKL
jgi:hypothetical protein